MSSRHHEPTVPLQSKMPQNYVFVPKGNVYITSHCRKQTQEAGQTVYTVLNAKNNAVGIRVPRHIRDAVQESHEATRDKRAQAVLRKDEKLEREFRAAVLAQFPGTPEESVAKIVGRAMAKRSRRVGRTGKLDVEERAALAVRAHIRHIHTDYDNLMRAGVARGEARSRIHQKICEVVRAWGGETNRSRSKKGKNGQAKRPSKGAARRSKATAVTGEKPKQNIPTPSGRSRGEKKLVVRTRSSTSVPLESPSPEPRAGSKEPGRKRLGASLLDDGDSESEEFAWSNSDLSLDEDDDDDYVDDEY